MPAAGGAARFALPRFDWRTRYAACFSLVLRVVLESELRAVTNAEKAFGIALALVGGLTMALAFAEVAVIVAALCSDRTSYRDQLERLWEGGARLRLPSAIRDRAFAYARHMHRRHASCDGSINAFTGELSPNLQSEARARPSRSPPPRSSRSLAAAPFAVARW